ncbi:hypothetical protein GIB67_016069 [Kingdonia uniflora]|uniref:J domain-containing protein n=1 Tax=Kingdonia uniflora TaxID=39325 RepID=A0A7J7L1X5_9MAGN|nr:hypothetical protein GIB67_016069 [Kingdonia uniflora]
MHYCSRACGVAQRIISIALRAWSLCTRLLTNRSRTVEEEIDPEEQKSEKPEQAYTASSDSYSSKGIKKSGASDSQQQDHYALLETEAGKLAKKDEIENHFKSIQEAYEILTDPVKRRVYDSTDEFDDEVPTDCLPQNFFKVFGPAFMRNGRWSASQPVPSLGDDNTPIDDVDIFYDYWYSFKSWREFPHADDFDLEQAESRDHKRWMERQNAKLREKARKGEYAKRKEEEKANKKKKKKKEAKFMANCVCHLILINFVVYVTNLSAKKELSRPIILKDAKSVGNSYKGVKQDEKVPPKPEQNGSNGSIVANGKMKPDNPLKNYQKKEKPWVREEIELLRKAILKYPKGTSRRWEVVSDFIGTGRSVDEILKATKTIFLQKSDSAKAFDSFLEKRKAAPAIVSPLTTREESEDVVIQTENPKVNLTNKHNAICLSYDRKPSSAIGHSSDSFELLQFL